MGTDVRDTIHQDLIIFSNGWRILGRLGLLDTVFNHMSALIADESGHFHLALNPEPLLPDEVLPETVRLVPFREHSPGSASDWGVNPDGLVLHSLIHATRMRPGVVIHTHSPYCIAVGCTNDGILPISQTALEFVGDVVTIEYGGLFRAQELSDQLVRLATKGGLAFLRNHGSLVIADTIPEAVYLAHYFEEACRIQVLTLSQSVPVSLPAESAIASAQLALRGDREKVANMLFEALCRQLKA